MVIVIDIKDFIIPVIFILCLIIYSVYLIIRSILNKFKHNCYKCKHYKLNDVASVGDCCWYKCTKLDRVDRHSFNDKEIYKKCNYYEEDTK